MDCAIPASDIPETLYRVTSAGVTVTVVEGLFTSGLGRWFSDEAQREMHEEAARFASRDGDRKATSRFQLTTLTRDERSSAIQSSLFPQHGQVAERSFKWRWIASKLSELILPLALS